MIFVHWRYFKNNLIKLKQRIQTKTKASLEFEEALGLDTGHVANQINHTGAAKIKKNMSMQHSRFGRYSCKKLNVVTLRTPQLPVSPFVVVPRHKFYKVLIQRNPGLGIKDA